jgi:hypothetical protein
MKNWEEIAQFSSRQANIGPIEFILQNNILIIPLNFIYSLINSLKTIEDKGVI